MADGVLAGRRELRRALRETTGANFKEVAVDAASRIEMHVTRVMNEVQQLATTPFLRTSVSEANRTYQYKDPKGIQDMIKDWQQRWKQRDKRSEFPLFINRIVTNYLIRWHDIRKSDYVGILVTDQQGALVVSSIPQVEYFYGKAPWWQALVKGGNQQPYVSEIMFDPAFGTHVVVVAAPILDDLQKSGRAYVSNAMIDGRFLLRACIVNFRTTEEDLRELIRAIVEIGRAIHDARG